MPVPAAAVRALSRDDAPLVQPLAARAFDDLAIRQGRAPRESTPAVTRHYLRQHEHLLSTGRGIGAFVGDELVGLALSYERGPLWVLALLVADPEWQGAGTGTALLRASLEGAPPLRLLHSSRDSRAMRAYAGAGFRLLPALTASGRAQVSTPVAEVLDVDLSGDLGSCRDLAGDLAVVVAQGGQVLALADARPGLVVVSGPVGHPEVTVLSPGGADAGVDLLTAGLARAADLPGDVQVGPLAPQEHWAVDVLLSARLELSPVGPVAIAGAPDPLGGLTPPPAVFI